MVSDLMQELKDADSQLQNEINLIGCGIISSFNRNEKQMLISHDYYNKQDGPKCYQGQKDIIDLFSSLHWRLYEKLRGVNSIAMFCSRHTMLWAQSEKPIPPLGIFHIEIFYGEIPCAKLPDEHGHPLRRYDCELANSVIHALGNKTIAEMPGILLARFGAIVFGHSPKDVLEKAIALEKVADLAWQMQIACREELTYIDFSVMNRFHSLRWGEASNYMQRIDGK